MSRRLADRPEADPRVAGVTFAEQLPRTYHPHRVVDVDAGGEAVPDPRWPGHRVSSATVGIDFFDVLESGLTATLAYLTSDVVSARGAALVLAQMGIMLGVCLLACIVPTRRALRVEPTQAMRADA